MQGMEAFGSTGKMRCPLLYLAAQCNNYPCAKALLDHGADPNASFTDPTTGMACVPLQACFDAQRKLGMPCALDIAAELIAAKADANTAGRTPDGCTELMICCEVGDAAATRFLLDHRADPNLGKHNGSSPLFKAAQAGHDLCVDLLIAARADLDKPFASGCTSLGMAAAQGHARSVSLLLNAGADAHVVAHADGAVPREAGPPPRLRAALAGQGAAPAAPRPCTRRTGRRARRHRTSRAQWPAWQCLSIRRLERAVQYRALRRRLRGAQAGQPRAFGRSTR